jgi:hypothetical protein
MAIVNIENIKAKFEAGDYPRSSDYIDMIDTLAALPAGGAGEMVPTSMKPIVGYYYPNGDYSSTTNQNLNQTFYKPWYLGHTTTFDRIGTFTNGVIAPNTANIRLGVFTELDGQPGTVLVQGLATYTTAQIAEVTIDITLSPGWYFLASNVVSKTGTVSQNGMSRANSQASAMSMPAKNLTSTVAWQQNSAIATSEFPVVGTLSQWDNVSANVVLRVA